LTGRRPWIGNVWSFTTAGFLIVDNFEQYSDDDAAGEAIRQALFDKDGNAMPIITVFDKFARK